MHLQTKSGTMKSSGHGNGKEEICIPDINCYMRKNKIKLIIIAIVCLLPMALFAKEKFNPELVVVGLIKSAQDNDLTGVMNQADLVKIASYPHDSKQPEDLIEFLKGIDIEKIQFEKRDYKIGGQEIIVRIIKPIACDFELEPQEFLRDDGRFGHRYRVIHVHP